ncbi:MAG: hypothetical protein WBB27_15170 [Maribacter sp.]
MIFFFGTRASKIKERKLKGTTCPYCQTRDSFIVSSYSKYFHFFWIPLIPLFKTHIAECAHCKKSYDKVHFTQEMQRSLENENRLNPVKRPLWQGCGCLVLVAFFAIMMSISFYGVYMRSENPEKYKVEVDPRLELLNADLDKLSRLIKKDSDSLTFALKECVDYDTIGGIDTEKIGYFTRKNGNSLLVLLRIEEIKKIKPKFRKDILDVVNDCLHQIDGFNKIDQVYIGVEGRWNTVLVKTPSDADLGGRFADKTKILPFYGTQTPSPKIEAL